MDVVTIGETMMLFTPNNNGMMRYAHDFTKKCGGAESNVAIGLSRLGHSVGWISKVGDDEFGRAIKSFVKGEGVDVNNVSFDKARPTGLYFKEFRREDDIRVQYYRKGSAASNLSPQDLDPDYIAKAEYIHLTGITPALSNSCESTIQKAIDIAKNHEVKVVFDPNLRKKLWDDEKARKTLIHFASQADIVLPGIQEGQFLFGVSNVEHIAECFLDIGVPTVVIKLGAEGAWYFTKEMNEKIPGFFVERIVDPVGAGDGFATGFLSGLLKGLPLLESVKKGNAIGSLVTKVEGDVEGLPEEHEIQRLIEKKLDDIDR